MKFCKKKNKLVSKRNEEITETKRVTHKGKIHRSSQNRNRERIIQTDKGKVNKKVRKKKS